MASRVQAQQIRKKIQGRREVKDVLIMGLSAAAAIAAAVAAAAFIAHNDGEGRDDA